MAQVRGKATIALVEKKLRKQIADPLGIFRVFFPGINPPVNLFENILIHKFNCTLNQLDQVVGLEALKE